MGLHYTIITTLKAYDDNDNEIITVVIDMTRLFFNTEQEIHLEDFESKEEYDSTVEKICPKPPADKVIMMDGKWIIKNKTIQKDYKLALLQELREEFDKYPDESPDECFKQVTRIKKIHTIKFPVNLIHHVFPF